MDRAGDYPIMLAGEEQCGLIKEKILNSIFFRETENF